MNGLSLKRLIRRAGLSGLSGANDLLRQLRWLAWCMAVWASGGGVNPSYRLVLRGQRSLTGNNQALIVLDNVIVPNEVLTNLNPEDVESVIGTVLKFKCFAIFENGYMTITA